MIEKVSINDFTVLLVCPSTKWSSIERRAIFDCTYLRNIGANPVLLCYKNTQIDFEAEREDITRMYIKRKKINPHINLNFITKLRGLIKENRFDIIHCYQLGHLWPLALLMKSNLKIPLIFTFNQNINTIYHNNFSRWLLRRVDTIFTLSVEIQDFVKDVFYIAPGKIKNIGCGLDLVKKDHEHQKKFHLGCVIDNINELRRLKYIVKVFRLLKSHSGENISDLEFSIFLGPRIYQKDEAKKVLTDIDYEFYEGDIMLYSLESKRHELKNLDLLIGIAFDEPINDYELISLINEIPVLFPRTAMRQSLMQRFANIGESYFEGDVREAKTKITKIVEGYPKYQKALRSYSEEIHATHGVEVYADKLRASYEGHYAKRRRFANIKSSSRK